MAEPVEIRIRPHHYDGDVLVAHVEFPQGDPGAGSGATSKFVISNVAEFDIPDDGPHRIAFDSANPSYFGGYEFENFGMGNVTEIPVDKGPQDGMHLELEVLASGLGETPNFIAKFELAKL
jgi:hypothetical protein